MTAPITIEKDWDEILTPRGRQELAGALPDFLMRQRWYAGKARTIASVEFDALGKSTLAGTPGFLALLRVEFADGEHHRYLLPLAIEREAEAVRRGPDLVVAPIRGRFAGHVLADAATSSTWVQLLLATFDGECPFVFADGGELRAASFSRGDKDFGEVTVCPVSGEQSNTAVRVGDRYLLKYYRRAEAGPHPELEIGEFLSTVKNTGWAPRFLGGVEYRKSADEESTALLVLTEWVEDARCAWDLMGELLASGDDRAYELAERLGQLTRDMHQALSSGAAATEFAPREGRPTDAAGWAAEFRRGAALTLELIAGELERLPEDVRSLAGDVLSQRSKIDAVFADCEATEAPGLLFRVHGDYHLGQVLCAGKSFEKCYAIDFEGEPERPLAERRTKWPPERDVAGMLRSFAYAVAMNPAAPARARDALVQRFFAGYEGGLTAEKLLPAFVLEKALYEVRYELQNRPAWVHFPLRGVLEVLGW